MNSFNQADNNQENPNQILTRFNQQLNQALQSNSQTKLNLAIGTLSKLSDYMVSDEALSATSQLESDTITQIESKGETND